MPCVYCHNKTGWHWPLGAFLGLVGVTGLYLAAQTAGGGFYLHGLVLFALCTAWIFRLIGQAFDAAGPRPPS